MTAIADKAHIFRAHHNSEEPFILANAWDAGSARLLEDSGHVAIGTTSAGYAFSKGQLDNQLGRDAIISNAAAIANATHLPVSADLENGFGDDAEFVAETIRIACEAGLAGGSIEDSTYDLDAPLYDRSEAADRVRAAVEAARSLSRDFVLTARAENFLVGRPDLGDAIKRLQAYQEAGADVLYAPGLVDPEDIRAVTSSVDRPVNVVVGLSKLAPNMEAFKKLGVKRISIGSAFARLAYGKMVEASNDMLVTGQFAALSSAMPYSEISERLTS